MTFLLPLGAIASNLVLGRCLGEGAALDEVCLLKGCVCFAFLSWLYAVMGIIYEMSHILRISVLSVPEEVAQKDN